MNQYHKIQSIYKRDSNGKFILGEWSRPEFEYLSKNKWVFTEKVDGTNIRVMWDGEKISFGGKTDAAQMPVTLYQALEKQFHAQEVVSWFQQNFPINECLDQKVCLYGEGYGAKIQKNGGNYRQDQGFVLFDIKVGGVWLSAESVQDIARSLGVDLVPTIDVGTLEDMIDLTKSGIRSHWGDFQAEGIVARPMHGLTTRDGHRIIVKCKTKDFL